MRFHEGDPLPHQCLKCGDTYPDGSPQILKGCKGCSGTRFFYTDQPLDAAERARISDRTGDEIERLMQAGPEPTSDRRPRRIPTKDELPLGAKGRAMHDADDDAAPDDNGAGDDEWVRMTPNHLRNIVEDVVKRSSDRKPVFRVGAPHATANDARSGPRPGQTLAEWFRESGGDPDEAARLRRHPAAQRTTERAGPVPDLIEELLADAGTEDDADDRTNDVVPTVSPHSTSGPTTPTRPPREMPSREHADPRAGATTPSRPSLDPAPAKAHDDGPTPRLRPATEILARPKMPPVDESLLPENTAGVDDLDEDEYRRLPPNTASVEEIQSAPVGGEEVSKWHEGVPPETIAIHDEGAYELNVKRLLEKNPIVVHKDGTYSLHLPSLMEMAGGKRRR